MTHSLLYFLCRKYIFINIGSHFTVFFILFSIHSVAKRSLTEIFFSLGTKNYENKNWILQDDHDDDDGDDDDENTTKLDRINRNYWLLK